MVEYLSRCVKKIIQATTVFTKTKINNYISIFIKIIPFAFNIFIEFSIGQRNSEIPLLIWCEAIVFLLISSNVIVEMNFQFKKQEKNQIKFTWLLHFYNPVIHQKLKFKKFRDLALMAA